MAVRKVSKARRRRYTCPDCQGKGTRLTKLLADVELTCDTCGGTGKVLTKPLDDIDALYDSMKVKDMTRRDFRRAYKQLMDPKKAARDLGRMRVSLEIEKQSRGRIRNG